MLFKFATKGRVIPSPWALGNKAIGYCLENEKPDEIPESLKQLLPDLLETISGDLDAMKSAMLERDYESIYTKAHSLKGVAGMFGFQKLAALITHLSLSIKAKNSVVVKELFAVLDTYLAQLQIQFKR